LNSHALAGTATSRQLGYRYNTRAYLNSIKKIHFCEIDFFISCPEKL